ncbi:MAG: DUF2786 domain-containing protein [Granulosicoccus sp.]|nr:DUF2786 domain-containing protein [Granulosicoccus sp.]
MNKSKDKTTSQSTQSAESMANDSESAQYGAASSHQGDSQNPSQPHNTERPMDREKLLDRIRKLFAMAQATEASPHEAEIALRRCQKLMMRYGIKESDLHTSQFSSEIFRSGQRVPMHIRWLGTAVENLHTVLFVTGGPQGPEFRGFEVDVQVARLTMEYLENATERSLTARRRGGAFPPGRSAAYDYRVSFAMEIYRRVDALVAERDETERTMTGTGQSLTIRKKKLVEAECAQDLMTTSTRYSGARPGEAAEAGRADGAKVSLDPQVGTDRQKALPAS